MSDPNPVVVDPASEPAPALLPLPELFPACFDWRRPQPLKLAIHQDLIAAGHDRIAVKHALSRYCQGDRYQNALQAGAIRRDLQGRPAGAVTEGEAAYARSILEARAAARAARLPNATPIPQEDLVSGRLELTVKFSELPRPLRVQDGVKIGVQTGMGIVTALLPVQVWRMLERAAQDYPRWGAVLSGALDRFADGEIALKHPALQVFEKKARPEVAAEGKGPEPNGPAVEAPEPKAPEVNESAVKAPDRKTPAAPPPAPPYPKLSLKGRGAAQGG